MITYTIYIKSNEHARGINTPTNARTYFTAIRVNDKETLKATVADLKAKGEHISEIATNLGARIYL